MPAKPVIAVTHDKYAHLEAEVSGLKTDVGSLKVDLSGVRADVRVLNESYHALERTVISGFEEIKSSIRDVTSSRDRTTGTIQTTTLLAVIGVVLPALALIGGVGMLILDPVHESIKEQKRSILENQSSNLDEHRALLREIQSVASKAAKSEEASDANRRSIIEFAAHAERDSVHRYGEQQIQLEQLKKGLERLSTADEISIAERSRNAAEIQWLKDAIKGAK